MASMEISAVSGTRFSSNSLLLTQILGGSLLIALCAQINIPLPFTPVPITMQNVAVLLLGGVLGSKKGALCVIAYLMESMVGMPVLPGGIALPMAIIGPTGGYMIGFVAQAYVMGLLVERQTKFSLSATLLAFSAAWTIQMGMGIIWLAQFVGWNLTLSLGLYPFIPGAILKTLLVTPFIKRRFE